MVHVGYLAALRYSPREHSGVGEGGGEGVGETEADAATGLARTTTSTLPYPILAYELAGCGSHGGGDGGRRSLGVASGE